MHFALLYFADVAELADALVSGSSEAIHVGSSPVACTRFQKSTRFECFFCFNPSRDVTDLKHISRSLPLKMLARIFLTCQHRPHQGKDRDLILGLYFFKNLAVCYVLLFLLLR